MRKILATLAGAALVAGCSATPEAGAPQPTTASVSAPATTAPTSPATAAPTSTLAAGGPVKKVDLNRLRLQARWWTWAATPEAVNPVLDETGEHCAKEQPDDLWLVAGSFGGEVARSCTWPAELPIAGPVLNSVDDEAGCREFLAGAKGSVTFDGRPVPVQRLGPETIRFVARADNPSGFDAGQLVGVACGLWFAVPAAAAGPHVLVIRGSSGDFSTAATYNLVARAA